MGLINSKRNERDEVKFSNPNGLYPTCSWDMKTVKKLILDKKLAPFYPGSEEKTTNDHDECPICFLYYTGGLNKSRCCKKGMCTECFLQIKKPNTPLSESTCPFCNRTKFTVVFTGPKTQEERQKEEEEEHRVMQLQQKMREEEIERDKERERQRQVLKGKEKAKPPDASDKDRKIEEPKCNDEPKTSERKSKLTKSKNRNKVAGRNESEQRIRYKSLPGTSEPTGPAPVPENSPIALPSSYPPIAQGGGSSPEKDLEEIMLMEAIRLSLMESTDKQSPRSGGKSDNNAEAASSRPVNDEGPSSPFSELFGVESEGNDDFEARVKGGIVMRTTNNKVDDRQGSFSASESDSEDEKEKEKEKNEATTRHRGRTSSTTVPIEETPLGSLEGN